MLYWYILITIISDGVIYTVEPGDEETNIGIILFQWLSVIALAIFINIPGRQVTFVPQIV